MTNSKLKIAAAISATIGLGLPQIASARDCVAEQDLADAVIYVMPVAYKTFTNKCTGQLKKSGFVARGGSKFISGFGGKQEAAWDGAFRFISAVLDKEGKGSEMTKLLKSMPPEVTRPFADAFIQTELSKKIKIQDCSQIELVLEPLAPLPPENFGKLVAAIAPLMPNDTELQFCKNSAQ